jgi:hypothetical protein
VGLGPVVSSARVLVHEIARAEALVKQRRARSFDHAGLAIKEHRTGNVLAKHVDAVELRVVVAAVLPKLDAHLVNALTRLDVRDLTRKNSPEAGNTREGHKKLSAAVWHGKKEIPVAPEERSVF